MKPKMIHLSVRSPSAQNMAMHRPTRMSTRYSSSSCTPANSSAHVATVAALEKDATGNQSRWVIRVRA